MGKVLEVVMLLPKYNLPGWYCSQCGVYRGKGCPHDSQSVFCRLGRTASGLVHCRESEGSTQGKCAVSLVGLGDGKDDEGGDYVFT